jgi:hypothetical protein
LSVDGKAEVIVEAKALRLSLTDQHAAQCVQYASILGVRWCLITNGVAWELYDAQAKGPLPEKKVAEFFIGIEEESLNEAWRILSMFSRESLARNDPLIGLLIDRVVADELTRPESGAVAALQRALKTRFGERVTGQEIVRRLWAGFTHGDGEAGQTGQRKPPSIIDQPPVERHQTRGFGELQELIDVGAIPADATLEARLRGVSHVGVLIDGQIEVNGKRYTSLSNAASALRGGMSSNGWKWWRYKGELLADVRDRVRAQSVGKDSNANPE